jgi:cobalt-zinc-cadmium efflux system membrane fusion protein
LIGRGELVAILSLEGKIVNKVRKGRDLTTASLALAAFGVAGCAAKPASTTKPAAPASVAKLPGEGDLVAVTLKPEAETRLAIKTGTVDRRGVSRALTMGGDVVVPPGRSSIVSAPQTGSVVVADGGMLPVPGMPVKKGQAVFTLLPILSADRSVPTPVELLNLEDAKIAAEGTLKGARSQFELARTNLDQIEKLPRELRNEFQLISTRTAYDQAKASLEAAERRLANFQKVMGSGGDDAGKLAPLPLRAPADGVLINVNVQGGQQVPAGSVLFEVANLDPVYIKVPVFVGEEEGIALDKDAAIGGLADAPGRPTRPGKPVVRTTPSANALASTVDLYYEVENHDGKLRPGQRVGVTLPLKGEAESLVVPYASILYDHNGGAWVYESMGKQVYARRRVVVDHVVGPEAVLAIGPKPGTKVVTDGAAELFGTEFGGSK